MSSRREMDAVLLHSAQASLVLPTHPTRMFYVRHDGSIGLRRGQAVVWHRLIDGDLVPFVSEPVSLELDELTPIAERVAMALRRGYEWE